jgi:tetratricopeptide (TPR) repeat protein
VKLECPVFLGIFWIPFEIMASETESDDKVDTGPDGEIDIESGLEQGLEGDLTGDSDTIVEGLPDAELDAEPDMATESESDLPTGSDTEPEVEPANEPDQAGDMPTDSAEPVAADPQGGEAGGDVFDALWQVADAFSRLVDALPGWLIIVLVALLAVAIGLIVGLRMARKPNPQPEPQPVEPKITRRALPAPESPVFVKYQEFLEQKGVSAKEFDGQVRAFSERYKEMRQNLRDLMPGDKSLDDAVEEIRDALDNGDFDHALGLLSEIGKREHADGIEKHHTAQKHLMAAAISKCVAGDLQMARMAYEDAAMFYREAVEALPDFQEDLHGEYLNKYGTASYQAGEPETAIAAFERALQILERKLGKNHPDVATALNNLALLHYSRGNYEAAEPLYQRSLAIDEHTLGIDHPGVATDLNNLALLYKKKGNLEEAEPLLRRAMEIKEKQFDPGHPSLVTGLKNYASLLRALGREEEAEVFERKATVLPPKRTGSAVA